MKIIYRLLYNALNELYADSPDLQHHRDVTLELLKSKAEGRDIPPTPDKDDRPIVVVAVGHSRKGDNGAESWDGSVSEHRYNLEIATELCELLEESALVKPVLLSNYGGKTYSQAIKWLADKVNSLGKVALVVELHFNSSSSPHANGHEFLFWHSSQKGAQFAQHFSQKMTDFFPTLKERGPKPIKSGGRGSLFLRKLIPVCLILEPFFGSNSQNWSIFRHKEGKHYLVRCYFEAIVESVL